MNNITYKTAREIIERVFPNKELIRETPDYKLYEMRGWKGSVFAHVKKISCGCGCLYDKQSEKITRDEKPFSEEILRYEREVGRFDEDTGESSLNGKFDHWEFSEVSPDFLRLVPEASEHLKMHKYYA